MTSCIIQLNDRFLIEMTDKSILDYEKSNYLVVRSMRKGKKRNIKRFVDNKKRSFVLYPYGFEHYAYKSTHCYNKNDINKKSVPSYPQTVWKISRQPPKHPAQYPVPSPDHSHND